jgi:hypothetical protein
MMDDDERGAVGEVIGRRNQSTQRKPAPVPLSSLQIPPCLDLGSNPGHRDGKPAADRLSYGTAVNHT